MSGASLGQGLGHVWASPQVVGTLKSSIEYASLPFLDCQKTSKELQKNFLCPQVVWTLKPSIEYASLPFAPLRPPSLPFTPFVFFALLHSPSPLSPTEVVGTLKPSIQYALLPFVPREVVGTLKPSMQYALFPFVPTEVVGILRPSIQYVLPLCPHRGGGDPKT